MDKIKGIRLTSILPTERYTPKTDEEKIDVMRAYLRGETIEHASVSQGILGVWSKATNPTWSWGERDYRIKPNIYKRPFINAEEFWSTLIQHGGRLRYGDDTLMTPLTMNEYGIVVMAVDGTCKHVQYRDLMSEIWEFYDGIGCFIEYEEAKES